MKKSFTQIPNAVIRSGKKITDAEFRLYCTLLSFDFKQGFVFPSRETLGKHMGASRAKIDRVKNSLEKKGAFRKQRRGQGITNLYFLNKDFLYKADDSNMSPLGNSPVSGKEDEVDNTFNNYLPTSSTFKETNFCGETQPLPKPQANGKPHVEVIFRNLLKKTKISVDSWLDKYPDEELDSGTISRNTDAAVKGILYYIRKYKVYCGIDHPLYKLPQLRDCMEGFLDGIWQIEQSHLHIPLDDVVIQVINRWFETTSINPNRLRLSVFVGKLSLVFSNSLESVMADYGLERKEAHADS